MVLKHIQKILESSHFNVILIEDEDLELSLNHILISWGANSDKTLKTLEVTAQKISLEHSLKQNPLFRIQFKTKFPFKVKTECTAQIEGALHFINSLIDFPGFEYDALEDEVSYRYIWLIKDSGLDKDSIKTIISNIILSYDIFSSTLEEISIGKMSFNEFLEHISGLAKNNPFLSSSL